MGSLGDPSRIERLIDRQMHLWEVRQRLAREGGETARRELAHLPHGPWISCSVQLGSGGHDLAIRLGERLGWQVFDREILDTISRNTRWKEKILSALDEHAVGPVPDYLRHLIVPGHPGSTAFVRELLRVVAGIAHRGRAILVGRGANWILDPRSGLRIRFVAERDFRIGKVRDVEGLDREGAERRIDEDDGEKASFIGKTFHRDIDDPSGYDLVLNLGSLSPDDAVEICRVALTRKLQAHA